MLCIESSLSSGREECNYYNREGSGVGKEMIYFPLLLRILDFSR